MGETTTFLTFSHVMKMQNFPLQSGWWGGGRRVYFNQMLLYFNTVLPLGDFFFFPCHLFIVFWQFRDSHKK